MAILIAGYAETRWKSKKLSKEFVVTIRASRLTTRAVPAKSAVRASTFDLTHRDVVRFAPTPSDGVRRLLMIQQHVRRVD